MPAGTFRGHSLLRGAPGSRVVTRNAETPATYAVTEDRYRLIFRTKDGTHQLYDATADAGETRDVADAQPSWAAAHRQALQWFLMTLRPDTPAPAPPLGPDELEALRALGYVN